MSPAQEYRVEVAEMRGYGFIARILRRWLGITDCGNAIHNCFDDLVRVRTYLQQKITTATKETNERIDIVRNGNTSQISALSRDLAKATQIHEEGNSGPSRNLLVPHRIVTAEEILARFEALEQELGLVYQAPSAAPHPTYTKKEPKA